MPVPPHLHRRIRRRRCLGARREVEPGKQRKRGERDAGEALCGEFSLVDDDDFLDVGVRGLLPVRSKRGHCCFQIGVFVNELMFQLMSKMVAVNQFCTFFSGRSAVGVQTRNLATVGNHKLLIRLLRFASINGKLQLVSACWLGQESIQLHFTKQGLFLAPREGER